MNESLAEFIAHPLEEILTENQQFNFGSIPSDSVERIFDESNIDLTGHLLTMDSYSVRHILKSHGNMGSGLVRT